MTGNKLKANHGQRRFIILKDGQMLELLYDLNAVMRHETEFELPLRSVLDPLREKVTARVDASGGAELRPDARAARIAQEMAREMVRERLAPGHIRELAEWAYALTETWREDQDIQLTWQQFRRLLHEPPPMGAATNKAKAKLEQATAWMMAVAEVRAREEVDEGNDQADESDPGAPSEDPQGSTGMPSGTSAPSSGDEPSNNSGG